MTSNLTLAQKLKAKSEAQALILQEAQNSALLKLSESLSESLNASLSTMQSATDDLCETAEGMGDKLTSHLSNMNAATAVTLEDYRKATRQALIADQKQMNEMLGSYRTGMATMMQQHNESIKTILKEQAKPYLISALIAVAIILILGILFGLAIAKILS